MKIVPNLGLLAYEAQRVTLPLHPGVKSKLLEKADYAYRHPFPFGFAVDLSAPQVAHDDFAALYDRSGSSQCSIVSVDEYKLQVAGFSPIVAWELLNWSPAVDINPTDEKWQLGIEAMREFQRLSIFRSAGLAASEQTNAEKVLGMFRQ